MTETVRINLDKTYTSLKIISIVAGALIACAAVYGGIDDRMDKLEQKQATFEGVIEERTRNTAKRVDDIYDIVKNWEVADGKTTKKN
jgi:hypothetical protein